MKLVSLKSFAVVLVGVFMSTAALASSPETTPAENVKYTGDVRFAGFCKAVLENSVTSIQHFATRSVGEVAASRRAVIRAVAADNGVTCNGKTLIEFSLEKNATDVHAFLVAQR
ncbi:DUF3718 domain-containing protein [Alteromonas flava]|uniref:DUF3718 domain-containing protein n=1 Tax=Alteromonas flava TaxID=2048003 RepID=UPI000C283AEF|nr:DUF3718 domain-containing protein [Alteromonas flava]